MVGSAMFRSYPPRRTSATLRSTLVQCRVRDVPPDADVLPRRTSPASYSPGRRVCEWARCSARPDGIAAGAFRGFPVVSVSVVARRRPSAAAVLVLLPLCLVAAALCLAALQVGFKMTPDSPPAALPRGAAGRTVWCCLIRPD
jgi:hypothetical protein